MADWMIWLIVVLVVVVAAAIGFFVGRYATAHAGQAANIEAELQAEREKHNEYRQEVESHLGVANELFERLSDDYRSLHAHLAQASRELASDRLAAPAPPPERLEYSSLADAETGDGDEPAPEQVEKESARQAFQGSPRRGDTD